MHDCNACRGRLWYDSSQGRKRYLSEGTIIMIPQLLQAILLQSAASSSSADDSEVEDDEEMSSVADTIDEEGDGTDDADANGDDNRDGDGDAVGDGDGDAEDHDAASLGDVVTHTMNEEEISDVVKKDITVGDNDDNALPSAPRHDADSTHVPRRWSPRAFRIKGLDVHVAGSMSSPFASWVHRALSSVDTTVRLMLDSVVGQSDAEQSVLQRDVVECHCEHQFSAESNQLQCLHIIAALPVPVGMYSALDEQVPLPSL